MQEAMIHLWHQEEDEPGHTQSWYLQNCRHYLSNSLKRDHSIDSLLRRSHGSRLNDDSEVGEDAADALIGDESTFASRCEQFWNKLLIARWMAVRCSKFSRRPRKPSSPFINNRVPQADAGCSR